jgi:hypothetical protein
MLSHRKNVRTSKFWRKSKEKKRNFFRKFTKGIKGFDLGQKKYSKLFHACVPLSIVEGTGGRGEGTGVGRGGKVN